MDFLRFWKKPDQKGKAPLSEIPIFSSLTQTESDLVEKKVRLVEYKKGDMVYRIGEPAEAFYIILSGRFRVTNARRETVGVLAQGEYFGESSILLEREHSATVIAKNDGLIFKIEKKDFLELLREIPALSLHVSRTLGQRLRIGTSTSRLGERKIVGLFDFQDDQRKQRFCWDLSAMLGTAQKRKIILVHVDEPEQPHLIKGISKSFSVNEFAPDQASALMGSITEEKGSFDFVRISRGADNDLLEKQISAFLNFLIHRYDFVLLELPTHLDGFSICLLRQADLIYFLVSETNVEILKVRSHLKQFETSLGFSQNEVRLLLCEGDGEGISWREPVYRIDDSASIQVFHHIPLDQDAAAPSANQEFPYVLMNRDSKYSKAVRFIARELTGKLVGLALGSGAAFGFAHMGVIKALEEAGVGIDMVVGSSIGALVAALWGSGLKADELTQIARGLDQKSIFFKLVGFRDFSIPHRGFFKGIQVSRFLRGYLKNKTFKDLEIPVKIVAADLFTGQELIFDQGDLVDAVRASISIPGIFRPVKLGRDLLIDGGVVDPLPVKVLSHFGVKKIIAVNVLSSSEDHLHRKNYFEERSQGLSAAQKKGSFFEKLMDSIGRKIKNHFRDNVFNVLMNTIQFLEYGIAQSSAQGADVTIHPVLSNSHWAEFYSVDKFVRCGDDATREHLAEIKKLVEE